ncbi:MAG: response regulator [Anaerolineae bacterium]|nr:response regulator [Anaerolineae bacterium]
MSEQTVMAQAGILVVDDNLANLRLLAKMLAEHGYKIRPATTGRMALSAAQTEPPDLILLDIMMPELDGYEVCAQLKANERTRDIPIIFISAMSDVADKVKAFAVGGVDYIPKPFQVAEVLARVETHLAMHRLQKELQAQNEALQKENLRRMRVQDALRESRERYRLLAENSTDMISTQTPQGVYRYVSPACRTLLGYEMEEIIGRSAQEFVHPEDLPAIRELNQFVEQWPAVSTITYRARCKDGGYIWLETTHRIVRDPKMGMVVEIIAVSRDITQRKAAEDALQQAHDKLEERVQERTAELAKTNLALGRFVPYEFLYFLGHESIVEVNLGDQTQQEMTVLCSDIRDFTGLSETMSPQDNINFLNAYLQRVSPIIRQHHGFIDKYIGDAMMALFPEKIEDALQAAIAIQQEVLHYNRHRQEQGYRPIQIGVGLHTGLLMLGTIGEAQRMESTVISDAVNLAFRLEGLTKLYGAGIVISQNSLFSLDQPTRYRFRFLDRVQVKGKTEAVSVFEILDGCPPEIADLKLKTLEDFEKGLLHYHGQEFAQARTHFEQVLKHNPADKAARFYLKRATHFNQYGVPPDWEGVEELTEK